MDSQSELAAKDCVPVGAGTKRLAGRDLTELADRVRDWKMVDEHHLERSFAFPDFDSALAFTDRVGALAHNQNHHPDIQLSWGKVTVTLFTHKLSGLTENDFIFAAKVNSI